MIMKNKKTLLFFFVMIALSVIMHWQHFSKDIISIHVWRQTQTQSTIDNFYEEDMNILNPRRNDRGNGDGIFRMEFPLMQWIVALNYKIFGQSVLLTRIVMFLTGLLSLLGMYVLFKIIFKSHIAGMMAAWALCFSPSFYFYTINPLPDNFALCLAIWSLYFIFKWIKQGKLKNLLIGSFILSISSLCKLPFILYYSIVFSFILVSFIRKQINIKELLIQSLAGFGFAILPLIWYASVVSSWDGNGIVQGIVSNEFSGAVIFDYLQYNLVSVLPELLLNYGTVPFFIAGFYFLFKRKKYKSEDFIIYLLWSLSILAYFIFEINMIAKIHDYYLFPFYPILFILVVYGAMQFWNSKKKYVKYIVVGIFLILPLTAIIRMHVRWNESDPGFNKDLLIHKTELRNVVPDDGLCVVGNDVSHYIFFYYIHKKGWCFDEDNISKESLQKKINQGAVYLYTDSRAVDENTNIKPLLQELIGEYGTIRVWKLNQSN